MTVQIIALVLRLQKLAELFHLLLHLEQARDLEDVLFRFKGFDDVAALVLIVAVQLRAVVGNAAELLDIVHGVVGRNAHDRTHLIPLSVVMRAPALAADAVKPLQNGVVLIPLLLEVHARGKPGRTAADDADARVFIHDITSMCGFFFNNLVNYTTIADRIQRVIAKNSQTLVKKQKRLFFAALVCYIFIIGGDGYAF